MICLWVMAKEGQREAITKRMLDEAIDAILDGINGMFLKRDKRLKRIENRQTGMESLLSELKVELSQVKDTVNGLKGGYARTPTRKEVEELKGRVVSQAITNSYTYDFAVMLSATC